MALFCKKTFLIPLSFPSKLHKRPPARLSLAQIPGAIKLFREFRRNRIYRRKPNLPRGDRSFFCKTNPGSRESQKWPVATANCFLAGSFFGMRVDGTGIDTRPSQLASKGTMEHGLKQIAQAAAFRQAACSSSRSPAGAQEFSPRRKPWEQGFQIKPYLAPDGAEDGDRLGSRAFLVKTHTPTASGLRRQASRPVLLFLIERGLLLPDGSRNSAHLSTIEPLVRRVPPEPRQAACRTHAPGMESSGPPYPLPSSSTPGHS